MSRGELPWLRDTIAGGVSRRADAPASGASSMAGLAARRRSMVAWTVTVYTCDATVYTCVNFDQQL